jgi:glycosyltransferase involved in cell wall biosynthesis
MQYVRYIGLADRVILTGWQSPPDFARYMLALDIGIHLRYPHIGGTPYTPIRLMGLGINTIVSEIEPLAEIPEGACIKILPDDYQERTLAVMLDYLADHADFRQQLSQNAQRFIAQHHDLSQIARSTLEFMEQALAAR